MVNNFIFNQAEILDSIQTSVNNLTKEIREMRQADSGAFAIDEANNNQLTFYADVDGTPDVERVRYFLAGNCLKVGIIKPSGTPPRYPTANEIVSNVSCNVVNAANEPIFSYYSAFPSSGTQLTTPADPHVVKVVKLYLRIGATGRLPLPVSKIITTYTTPRNINQEVQN